MTIEPSVPAWKPSKPRSFSFVLAVPLAIFLLWLLGLGALLLEGGDCFGSDADCQAFSHARQIHAQVLIGTLFGLTAALGYAAFSARGPELWWVPAGFFLTMPATLVLALASACQIKGQFDERASGRQVDRGAASSDLRAR